jgi:hypothetical protein
MPACPDVLAVVVYDEQVARTTTTPVTGTGSSRPPCRHGEPARVTGFRRERPTRRPARVADAETVAQRADTPADGSLTHLEVAAIDSRGRPSASCSSSLHSSSPSVGGLRGGRSVIATAVTGDMAHRIVDACTRTSGIRLSNPADVTRCVLDSMALAVREAIHDAIRLSGHRVDVLHVVGGGVSNTLFCQLVADACQLPVLAALARS